MPAHLVWKGTSNGFSSHTWGAAVDLDSVVNPYSTGGKLSLEEIQGAIKNYKGYYKQYWYFRNPRTRQTYIDYLKDSLRRGAPAMSLYEFIAGPLDSNGIARIFAKYGFFAGMQYRQARKDVMHFEYIPDWAQQASSAMSENRNKISK